MVTSCAATAIVSDLGPHATVALAGREPFERSYLARLDRDVRPTAILWLHFSSDEPVLDYSAIAVCGTRRVNMLDAPSYDCPDFAPPGKYLYTVGAAPLDGRGDLGHAGAGRIAQDGLTRTHTGG